MAEKIFEIEHEGEEVILRFKRPDVHLSEETRGHLKIVRKETLLAIRSILDRAIEGTEDTEQGKGKKRKTKIEVQ